MASRIASWSLTCASPRILQTTIAARRSSPFSTTSRTRASSKQTPPNSAAGATDANGNPTYPSFNLISLGVGRRGRILLAGGLVVLACIETTAWIKVWPKIMGKSDEEESK